MCRNVARPPLAQERLKLTADRRCRYNFSARVEEWTLALREKEPVPIVRRGVALGLKTGVRLQMIGRRD